MRDAIGEYGLVVVAAIGVLGVIAVIVSQTDALLLLAHDFIRSIGGAVS